MPKKEIKTKIKSEEKVNSVKALEALIQKVKKAQEKIK